MEVSPGTLVAAIGPGNDCRSADVEGRIDGLVVLVDFFIGGTEVPFARVDEVATGLAFEEMEPERAAVFSLDVGDCLRVDDVDLFGAAGRSAGRF